jgi:hypothetical protein
MIAQSYKNQRVPDGIVFVKAHKLLPSTFTEEDIVEIKYSPNHLVDDRFFVHSIKLNTFTADQWAVGMRAAVTNSSGFDGEYEILLIDATNKILYVKSTFKLNKVLTTGKAVGKGTVNSNTLPGIPLYNDDNKIVALVYKGDNVFFIDIHRDIVDVREFYIQVMNLSGSVLNCHLYWSLDAVNWLDFVVPIEFTVDPNASEGGNISQLARTMKLKLVVDANNDDEYYILAS